MSGIIDFVLADPPRKIRQELGRPGCDCDVLTTKATKRLVVLFSIVKSIGTEGHIFCPEAQVRDWIDAMFSVQDNVT